MPMDADLLIINHCLQQSLELQKDIDKYFKYIKEGGRVFLIDEVQRKLHNPFHANRFCELFLMNRFAIEGIRGKVIQD